jgi:adiponectin receptor
MNRIDYLGNALNAPMLFADRFVGILVLGTVNFFPTFHYSFFCDPSLRNLYILLMTLSGCSESHGMLVNILSLLTSTTAGIWLIYTPAYSTPAYRRMRTYTFITLGFVAVFPFVHAIWRYGVRTTISSPSYSH